MFDSVMSSTKRGSSRTVLVISLVFCVFGISYFAWHRRMLAMEADRIANQQAAEKERQTRELERRANDEKKHSEEIAATLKAASERAAEARCDAALDDQRHMDNYLAGSYSLEDAAMRKTIRAIDSTVTRYPRSEAELRRMPCGDGRQLVQLSDHGGTRMYATWFMEDVEKSSKDAMTIEFRGYKKMVYADPGNYCIIDLPTRPARPTGMRCYSWQ